MVFNGTLVLMEALMHQKKTDINFSKSKKVCIIILISYLFVNGKEICKFIVSNKENNSPSQFCLGSISVEA